MLRFTSGFTHVDPFEDTESCMYRQPHAPATEVSPTSIRSRILKGNCLLDMYTCWSGFTHVDPFEDTESVNISKHKTTFHNVSPTSIRSRILKGCSRTSDLHAHHVSPTSIRSRILKVQKGGAAMNVNEARFTHVDPFEDTERR